MSKFYTAYWKDGKRTFHCGDDPYHALISAGCVNHAHSDILVWSNHLSIKLYFDEKEQTWLPRQTAVLSTEEFNVLGEDKLLKLFQKHGAIDLRLENDAILRLEEYVNHIYVGAVHGFKLTYSEYAADVLDSADYYPIVTVKTDYWKYDQMDLALGAFIGRALLNPEFVIKTACVEEDLVIFPNK